MSLRTELEQSGSWLFRHRSYLPLALVAFFLPCLCAFSYLGRSHFINEIWQVGCLAVSFLGLAVRIEIGRAHV